MFNHDIQADYITLDGQKIEIGEVTYTIDCYDDGNVIGSAIARKLEFTTDAGVDFEEREFTYTAVVYENGAAEETQLGTFIAVEVTKTDNTGLTKVTATDTMLRFSVPYETTLDYHGGGVTVADVLAECCEVCQVPLASGQTIANLGFVVDSNQFTDGQLYRDVIKAIAQISGTYAQIIDDALVFRLQSGRPPVSITGTEYATLDAKRTTHPINTVALRNSQVEGENVTKIKEGTPESGQNLLVIADNPFAYTQEKREQLIDALFDAVVDWGYVAYESKGSAHPALQCGDPVQVMCLDGTVLNSYVLRMEYRSPNGVESTIAAPSMTKATVQYQFAPDAKDLAKRTEIRVDKAEGQITSLAEKTDEIYLSTDAQWKDLERRIVENQTRIEQTAQQVMASMSVTGGNNILQNSVGYKGLDYWTVSDPISYAIVQNAETDQNTISGSGILLNSGSYEQSFHTEIGAKYTLAFKYSKAGIGEQVSTVQIATARTSVDVLNTAKTASFLEVSYTWTAEEPAYTVRVYTQNDAFSVYDMRLNMGDSGQTWSQGKDEIYGKGLLLDKTGIEINALDGSATKLQIDNDSLYIKNGNATKAEVSDEQVYGQSIRAENALRIANVEFRALSKTRIIIAEV